MPAFPKCPSAQCSSSNDLFPVPWSRETKSLTHAHCLQKGISRDWHFREKEGSLKRDCAEPSQSKIILQVYAGPSLQTTLYLIKSNQGALDPCFQEPEYGTHFKFGQTPSRRLCFMNLLYKSCTPYQANILSTGHTGRWAHGTSEDTPRMMSPGIFRFLN